MSYLAAVCLVLATVFSLVAWSHRRERFYLLIAAIAGLGLAAGLVLGIHAVVALPRDLGGVLVVLLVGEWAFGLPLPIARRLGWGLRSPAWEFDTRFIGLQKKFTRLYGVEPERGSERRAEWTRHVGRRGPGIVAKLGTLRAPDDAWRQLVEGYVDVYGQTLANLREGDSPERAAALGKRFAELRQRHEGLQQAYVRRTKALLAGTDLDPPNDGPFG